MPKNDRVDGVAQWDIAVENHRDFIRRDGKYSVCFFKSGQYSKRSSFESHHGLFRFATESNSGFVERSFDPMGDWGIQYSHHEVGRQ